MSRKPLPKREPRVLDRTLNDRQEKFARIYAATDDADQALTEAGYEHTSEQSAADAKCRLLKNPYVRSLVDDIRSKAAAKYGMDAEGTVARFKFVYLEAVADRDWGAAVGCLKELGKFQGIYSKHNEQKRYTKDDLERLRTELTAAGFDFTATNMPLPSTN